MNGHAAARVALRAAQSEADQSVGAVTVESGLVTSRTRPRGGSGIRGHAPRAGRGSGGLETRDRRVNRVPVDPGSDMVTAGLDELGDDDDNMQGSSLMKLRNLVSPVVLAGPSLEFEIDNRPPVLVC